MSKSNEFLEFVSKNPPPCHPGDKLFWFDAEKGKIRQDTQGISAIVLDDNWSWKLIDDETGDLITPNETLYFCITAEDAKKFRDEVGAVKYVVFKPDPEGKIVVESKTYSILKTNILKDIASLGVDEDYFTAIFKADPDVEVGMVIKFKSNCYLLCDDRQAEECFISEMDKACKRILEDVFDQ